MPIAHGLPGHHCWERTCVHAKKGKRKSLGSVGMPPILSRTKDEDLSDYAKNPANLTDAELAHLKQVWESMNKSKSPKTVPDYSARVKHPVACGCGDHGQRDSLLATAPKKRKKFLGIF